MVDLQLFAHSFTRYLFVYLLLWLYMFLVLFPSRQLTSKTSNRIVIKIVTIRKLKVACWSGEWKVLYCAPENNCKTRVFHPQEQGDKKNFLLLKSDLTLGEKSDCFMWLPLASERRKESISLSIIYDNEKWRCESETTTTKVAKFSSSSWAFGITQR